MSEVKNHKLTRDEMLEKAKREGIPRVFKEGQINIHRSTVITIEELEKIFESFNK